MSIIQPSQLLKITAFLFSMWIGNSAPCSADQQSIPPARAIEFEGDLPFTPKPLTLKGYLCTAAEEGLPSGSINVGGRG